MLRAAAPSYVTFFFVVLRMVVVTLVAVFSVACVSRARTQLRPTLLNTSKSDQRHSAAIGNAYNGNHYREQRLGIK